jgi:hypothetical protein
LCDGLSTIEDGAFQLCISLTSITIPESVTAILSTAFWNCVNLGAVYFEGDAPVLLFGVPFDGTSATVYYLPGTTGWGPFFANRPAVLWNPQVQPGTLGVRTNQFGFNITGTSNLVVVIEASTNLANPVWSPLQTNTLDSNSLYFTEPQWSNYPSRFYRLRWP